MVRGQAIGPSGAPKIASMPSSRRQRTDRGRGDGKLSVLFVDQAVGVGGSNRSLATVLAHLTDVQRLVALVPGTEAATFAQARRLVDELVELPTPTWRRATDRARTTMSLSRFAWSRRGQLDVVHANGLSNLNVALLPALIAGAHLVLWVHESAVTDHRFVILVKKLALRRGNVAAVSEFSKGMVVKAGYAPSGRVELIPNPIDFADVCATVRAAGGQRLRVAFVGSPQPVKGFQYLPAIVRATPVGTVDWLAYASPRHLMPGTFAELADLGVEVRERVDDVREVYARCDVVLMPSDNEAFGRVAAEAMANGLPVVASNLPALREVLGDGDSVAGLLVDTGDIEGFAAAVSRLAHDPELVRRLGEAGRRRAQAYDPVSVAERLRALYDA